MWHFGRGILIYSPRSRLTLTFRSKPHITQSILLKFSVHFSALQVSSYAYSCCFKHHRDISRHFGFGCCSPIADRSILAHTGRRSLNDRVQRARAVEYILAYYRVNNYTDTLEADYTHNQCVSLHIVVTLCWC